MHKCDDSNNGGRIENVRMEIKHLTILTDRRITNVDCAMCIATSGTTVATIDRRLRTSVVAKYVATELLT